MLLFASANLQAAAGGTANATLSATGPADVASLAAAVTVALTLSATGPADTASMGASVTVAAALSATGPADTASLQATVTTPARNATLSVTDTKDRALLYLLDPNLLGGGTGPGMMANMGQLLLRQTAGGSGSSPLPGLVAMTALNNLSSPVDTASFSSTVRDNYINSGNVWIVANVEDPRSVDDAIWYCNRRSIPLTNILYGVFPHTYLIYSGDLANASLCYATAPAAHAGKSLLQAMHDIQDAGTVQAVFMSTYTPMGLIEQLAGKPPYTGFYTSTAYFMASAWWLWRIYQATLDPMSVQVLPKPGATVSYLNPPNPGTPFTNTASAEPNQGFNSLNTPAASFFSSPYINNPTTAWHASGWGANGKRAAWGRLGFGYRYTYPWDEYTTRTGTNLLRNAVDNAIAAEAQDNKSKPVWVNSTYGTFWCSAAQNAATLTLAQSLGHSVVRLEAVSPFCGSTMTTAGFNAITEPKIDLFDFLQNAGAKLDLFGFAAHLSLNTSFTNPDPPWSQTAAGSEFMDGTTIPAKYSDAYNVVPGAWGGCWFSYSWQFAGGLLWNGGSAAWGTIDEPFSSYINGPQDVYYHMAVNKMPACLAQLYSRGESAASSQRTTVYGDPLYNPYRNS